MGAAAGRAASAAGPGPGLVPPARRAHPDPCLLPRPVSHITPQRSLIGLHLRKKGKAFQQRQGSDRTTFHSTDPKGLSSCPGRGGGAVGTGWAPTCGSLSSRCLRGGQRPASSARPRASPPQMQVETDSRTSGLALWKAPALLPPARVGGTPGSPGFSEDGAHLVLWPRG